MRAFVAVELPEAFAADVAGLARELAEVCEGRFVPAGNHHLTLAFLGEVDEAEVRRAMTALDEACAGLGPVELEPTGLGTFGRGRATTLWLGIRRTEKLDLLAERVRERLAAYCLNYDEKDFLAHVTLARHARLPRGELGDLAFPRTDEATSVMLFRSILGPDGARYKPLYSVELGWGTGPG